VSDRDYLAELLLMIHRPFMMRWEREHLRELRVLTATQRVKRHVLHVVERRM